MIVISEHPALERWLTENLDSAHAGDALMEVINGMMRQVASDYEEVRTDQKRLVRELDVALNGEGAAKQASLCDIVSQVKSQHWKLVRAD